MPLIEQQTKEDWTDWLLYGFRDWYDDERNILAFNPPGIRIDEPSAVPQIAKLYSRLPTGTDRRRFRQGLYNAIVRINEEGIPSKEILEDLASVSARIGATKTCRVIWNCLKNPELGYSSNDDQPISSTVLHLYSILAGFARYEGAYRFAEEALEDPNTPAEVLPLLLLKLSQARIERMRAYLRLMRVRFEEPKVKLFIQKNLGIFVQKIGIEALLKTIQYLNLSGSTGSDYWVGHELFMQDSSPLGCSMAKDKDGLPCYKVFWKNGQNNESDAAYTGGDQVNFDLFRLLTAAIRMNSNGDPVSFAQSILGEIVDLEQISDED